jgi:hypothetical protein
MDNFHLDFTSDNHEAFVAAFGLLRQARWVKGYKHDKVNNRLVLYWAAEEPGVTELPFPMDLTEAAEFAWGWLRHAGYGPEPDHDGSNHKGYRVYAASYGMGESYRALVVVEPRWAEFGK